MRGWNGLGPVVRRWPVNLRTQLYGVDARVVRLQGDARMACLNGNARVALFPVRCRGGTVSREILECHLLQGDDGVACLQTYAGVARL